MRVLVKGKEYLLQKLYDHPSVVYSLPECLYLLRHGNYQDPKKIFSDLGLKDQKSLSGTYQENWSLFDYAITIVDFWLSDGKSRSISGAYKQAKSEYRRNFLDLKNSDICFSADPWDILTMSMRGIHSCMAWSNHSSSHLVGSILDPYCAVLYLTDGRLTQYGSGMLARSVIRLVEDKGKDYLLLEKVYTPTSKKDKTNIPLITSLFKEYLQTHSDLPVIETHQIGNATAPAFEELASLPEHLRSYRDSKIPYTGYPK